MKTLIVLFALVATFMAQDQAPAAKAGAISGKPLHVYQVDIADLQAHRLRIKVSGLSGAAVQLPVWNALYQVRDFSQYVSRVTVRTKDGAAKYPTQLDKTTWQADGALEYEYDIVADLPGPFGAEANGSHIFLNLAEVLMYPVQGRNDAPAMIMFCGVPAGWRISTSLRDVGLGNGQCPRYTAPSYDALVDAPVEIGTFQESTFEIGDIHFRVGVDADAGDYDLRAITEMARKLAAAEMEWMQDRPIEHYVFIYHFPRHPTGGGMEHAYSTAINAPAERVKADPLSLADVTAHEFFHLWNVKRIRPQSLEPVDYTKEQYTRALWFSEGVTSTVADFARVRAGYLDEHGFLAELANDIHTLESRPARLTQSVEESSLDAWLEKYQSYDSPQRSISYYNKGEIVGLLLDLQMREASGGRKSLRDLFHWMNEHYAKQGKTFPDSRGVQEAAEAVTGADFSEFFARYVAGVDPLPYEKLFSTVGLRLEKQAVTVPDPGFRTLRRQSEGGVIAAVTPGSEADKAGLRVGDVVQQVNGRAATGVPESDVTMLHIGDTVELRVLSTGGTRKIKFKLAGTTVDNYTLAERNDATPAQRARRAAWLRGESE